jgi:benzoate/toluate 1,2-dioxygenase beta subunit
MTDRLREVESFLFHEAALLDAARYADWLALFTGTATYWVPSQPDQDNPFDTVSIVYDDRRLLETRVRRLTAPGAHAQTPPSRTSRLIGNVLPVGEDSAGLVVTARFQMVEYRRDTQRLFAGAYRHTLVPDGSGFRIQAKRVDLVNAGGVMDGITVPL